MENSFTQRLNKVTTEIKNMKMNQTIGGDSWVVYRSEVTAVTQMSREYKIIFSPEVSNNYVAVLKRTSPDRVIYGSIGDTHPDPNIPGVWWRPYQFSGGVPVEQTFFVYSTVKGTVSIQDVTGLGLGGV